MNNSFKHRGLKQSMFCLLAVFFTFFATTLQASAQVTQKQRLTREQLAEVQAKHIAKELDLSKAQKQQYIETYTRCQKEIWALGPHRQRGGKRNSTSKLSDAQIDSLQQARFERSQQVLKIREKYYKEYRRFLSPKQIDKAFKLEKDMLLHLQKKQRKARQ